LEVAGFADDLLLLASSEQRLQHAVDWFSAPCDQAEQRLQHAVDWFSAPCDQAGIERKIALRRPRNCVSASGQQ